MSKFVLFGRATWTFNSHNASDPDSAADALRGSVRKKLGDSRPQPAEFVSLHPVGSIRCKVL